MSLKTDYTFRKLVVTYLNYFFGNGFARANAHTHICDYICKINQKCKCSGFEILKEAMCEHLTNNIHGTIGYPEGRVHTVRELKDLVDRFCLKMDEIIPEALLKIDDIENYCKFECSSRR